MANIVENGIYRHNKTNRLYEVIGSAIQTETDEILVIYKPLYEGGYDLYARPASMFMEMVTINGQAMPRFEKTDSPKTFIV